MPRRPLPPPALVTRLRAAGCVFAEDEARLLSAEAVGEDLEALVRRRELGEPLEHVLGWAEFDGIRAAVAPGVFVPRGRSLLLVRAAARGVRPGAVVVDLCCGSGALGLAVARRVKAGELHTVDLDPVAVRCAERTLGGAGHAVVGDLDAPLPRRLRGLVDVLVANVPYVPSGEIDGLPREARLHEARAALDGGADGLDILRRVAALAPGWLAPGGRVVMEVAEHQAGAARSAVEAAGLGARVVRDARLEATVVVGRAGPQRQRHTPSARGGAGGRI